MPDCVYYNWNEASGRMTVEAAANATRQIPITVIAAMSMDGKKYVPVEGCEPGFYHTLYGGQGLKSHSIAGRLMM